MRTGWMIAGVLASFALAGCKKEAAQAPATPPGETAGAPAAAAPAMSPGRWEIAIKMDGMTMPNMADMPPEAKAMMQKSMGMEQHVAVCITPDEANKPDPGMFARGAKDCVYDHFSMDGGKLDAQMTCVHGGEKVTFTTTGTIGPEDYTVHSTMAGSTGGQPMGGATTMTAHHAGPCRGDELARPKPGKA